MGFENVMNLRGGIRGWVESGRPIRNYLGLLALKE
jgi:rhodanese-related sulfurtransferase